MTHAEAVLRGRLGGLALSATHDSRHYTARARAAFLQKFLEQVDPKHVLPEAERQRRAEAARKAHMARIALKSAQSRARGKKKKIAPAPTSGAIQEVPRGTNTQPSNGG
jgi:hypothetical protein